MSATELKSLLIHRISEIRDVEFLEALKTILDIKAETAMLPLTVEQRNEILESKKEVAMGLFVDNSQLENEVERWAEK